VRRLSEAGMEIGSHSWSHQRMVLKSSGSYDEEIARTHEAVAGAGAPAPTLFRPPFGKNLVGLPRAVERAGLTTVMWSVEDDLSGTLTPQEYADRIVDEAEPGSIILMHVMYPSSQIGRDALPLVLDGLGAKGLKAVTVTELLSVTARPRPRSSWAPRPDSRQRGACARRCE
jgi:Predicted xylanase/chitin deacetylase